MTLVSTSIPKTIKQCRDGDLIEITCLYIGSAGFEDKKIVMVFKSVKHDRNKGESILYSRPVEDQQEFMKYTRLNLEGADLPGQPFFVSDIVVLTKNYAKQYEKIKTALARFLPLALIQIVCAYHDMSCPRAAQQKKCIIA